MSGLRTTEAVTRPTPGRPDGLRLPAGRPLDPGPRSLLEHRFGRSLADVRVHTDDRAGRAAADARALAFTFGRDISFAAGRYRPDTTEGLELLAHEVAHTVQQEGVRPGLQAASVAPAGGALEREASAAARLAVHGPPRAGAAAQALHQRASGPTLAFAREWDTAGVPAVTGLPQGVAVTAVERSPGSTSAAAFRMTSFRLPKTKGPVLDAYQKAAAAGALEATVGFRGGTANTLGSRPATELWQGRASTKELRDNWLAKVGWPSGAEADKLWHEKGGVKGTAFKSGVNPRVGSGPVDMDHVVELQLGGTNIPGNIQPLDSKENQASGRDIWRFLVDVATPLAKTLPGPDRVVTLSFVEVSTPDALPTAAFAQPGTAQHAWDVDFTAMQGMKPGSADGRDAYKVTAGAAEATFWANPGAATTDLWGDKLNEANAELVPGLILTTLNRGSTPNQITAFPESAKYKKRTKPTRVPITLAADEPLHLTLRGDGESRRLAFAGKDPKLAFTYPYLSTGFLVLSLGDKGLTGKGELVPSIPLLRSTVIKVQLADGVFDGTLAVDKSKVRIPGFPQFQCTRCDITVALSPELRVVGTLGFAVGKLLTGELTAEPNPTGILAKGALHAHIPKVEQAEGTVTYQNGQFRGEILVDSGKLATLPGSPRGQLRIGFDDHGIHPTGRVDLTLPGGQPASLGVERTDKGWLFTGDATFDIPGLQPAHVNLAYDGEHLTATGSSGVTYGGLQGTVTVRYRDGKLSGEGTANLKRGRVDGTVHLVISPTGALHGKGSVRVRITEGVVGTVGVEKPEVGPLRLSGALELPPRIVLFEGISARHELFNRHLDIPIWAIPLPVGSIGVIAQIGGAFGYSYAIGPATLDHAVVKAGFNPLADNQDLALEANARLSIPASVGFFVSVRGAVGLGAGVGSVTGGLSVTADVGLRGGVFSDFHLEYAHGRFLATTDITVEGSPTLKVTLSADITAEALSGTFEERWLWRLAEKEWGSAFRLAMVLPLRYASDEPFRLPALSDIRFQGPDLDLPSLLPALAEMAAG